MVRTKTRIEQLEEKDEKGGTRGECIGNFAKMGF